MMHDCHLTCRDETALTADQIARALTIVVPAKRRGHVRFVKDRCFGRSGAVVSLSEYRILTGAHPMQAANTTDATSRAG
ncbi:MAG: hypothetical protein AAFR35_03675 [Pseudomonadota bacterium]